MKHLSVGRRLSETENSPSVIALTRQAIDPIRTKDSSENKSSFGAYEVLRSGDDIKITIIASGSETSLAIEICHKLATENIYSKVISMPCQELFDQQSEDYKNDILNETEIVISIEAAETCYWKKYTGTKGLNFGINDFGKSAPYKNIYNHFGLNVENIIKKIKEKIMKIKVGINGMGRIGRMIVRSIIENNNNNIEIKHINNRTNSETCSTLLKYDSIHGKFNAEIGFDDKHLIINKNKITFSRETDLNDINWKKYNVDYVFECTGKFNSKDKLEPHLNNGAKKVIVSLPCKNADKTIVFGVNESKLRKDDKIISAASCTTNCLAPVAHVLNEAFEIEKGFMTTIHAFTSDQRILDNSHKDLRRARSASQSIVPTSTGASKAIGEIIPSLKGKLEGIAMRVPTPNVSLVELVFCAKKDLSIEKINSAFQNFSKKNKVLQISKEKLVSIDFNHNPASSIIDESLTNVVGKNMGKISAWYDNEWGFSNRMCDIAEYLHKIS